MLNALIGGNNYLMWMIPGVILTIYAQFRLKRKFGKYSKIENAAQITGKDTSRKILNSEDLQKVPIKSIRGKLTDHYDPRTKTVNLSQPIYGKTSIGAMGVAAHETGHAIQDKNGYIWMRIRGWIVPFASIGTNFGYVLILAGLVIGWQGVARIGVLLFLLTTLFALITLPVEFNASKRAKKKLQELGITEGEEDKNVDDVLDAAAFTYVASFATSAIQGLYWWLTVRKEFHEETDIGDAGTRSVVSSGSDSSAGGALSKKSSQSDKGTSIGGAATTAAAAATTAKLLTGNDDKKEEKEEEAAKESKTLAGTAAGAAGKALIGSNDEEASEEKSKTLVGSAAGAAGKALIGPESDEDTSEATHESRRSNTSSNTDTDADDSDEKVGSNPIKTAKTAGKVVKTAGKLTGS